MSNIPPEPSDELINTVVSLLAYATHMRKFSFYQPVPDDWLSTEDDDELEAFCLFCHRSILSAPTYFGPIGPVTLSPIKVPANGECRRVATSFEPFNVAMSHEVQVLDMLLTTSPNVDLYGTLNDERPVRFRGESRNAQKKRASIWKALDRVVAFDNARAAL